MLPFYYQPLLDAAVPAPHVASLKRPSIYQTYREQPVRKQLPPRHVAASSFHQQPAPSNEGGYPVDQPLTNNERRSLPPLECDCKGCMHSDPTSPKFLATIMNRRRHRS